MAFDITPYIDMAPSQVRSLIRQGKIDFPTAGMCRGYAQANLVILPPEYAADFEEFTAKIPFPVRFWKSSKALLKLTTWEKAEISAQISPDTAFMKTEYLQRKSLMHLNTGKKDMSAF